MLLSCPTLLVVRPGVLTTSLHRDAREAELEASLDEPDGPTVYRAWLIQRGEDPRHLDAALAQSPRFAGAQLELPF